MVRSVPTNHDLPVIPVWLACDCHVSVLFCRHLNQHGVKNLLPGVTAVNEPIEHLKKRPASLRAFLYLT
jgi:hypothetical protein